MQEITKKMGEQRAALIEANLKAIEASTIFAVDVHVPTICGGTVVYQIPGKTQAIRAAMQAIKTTSMECPTCE